MVRRIKSDSLSKYMSNDSFYCQTHYCKLISIINHIRGENLDHAPMILLYGAFHSLSYINSIHYIITSSLYHVLVKML